MKNLFHIVALSLFAACFTEAKAQSVSVDYQGVAALNNTRLAEHGDSLNVTFELSLNAQAVQKHEALSLIPRVVAQGGGDMALPEIVILGKNKSKTLRRWERTMSKRERNKYMHPKYMLSATPDSDTTMLYNISVPYEFWMDDAVLAVNIDILSYRGEHHLLTMALGGRTQLEAKLPYEINPYVNFITPLAEQKSRKQQGQAFLDFQSGRSEIIPTYRRNPEELEKIRAAFHEVVTNPDVTVNGLFIEGYASPEGSYATNSRLSLERSSAFVGYIVREFSLPITAAQIRVGSVAEDWDGVRAAVSASNMARKDQVLSIIDNTSNPDQREAKLRQLGAPWQILMRDVFPDLRRVEYMIDFSVRDYSTQEAEAMVGKSDMLLSQLELYQVAAGYDINSAEYANIMLGIIPQHYPNDTTATINAAAAMIRRGETATAKRYLEKIGDAPQAMNNLGVIYMLEGDLDRAQALFEIAAANASVEAAKNIEEIEKKRKDNIRMERYLRR